MKNFSPRLRLLLPETRANPEQSFQAKHYRDRQIASSFFQRAIASFARSHRGFARVEESGSAEVAIRKTASEQFRALTQNFRRHRAD